MKKLILLSVFILAGCGVTDGFAPDFKSCAGNEVCGMASYCDSVAYFQCEDASMHGPTKPLDICKSQCNCPDGEVQVAICK